MKEKPAFSGIICEFNPLHQGHRHLLMEAKRHSRGVVCVMSGNWVQRGEPAILSKFARAEAAVCCGADMVIDLPVSWACARAERFAYGAVSLLHQLGCIGELWFGSECGDASMLDLIARFLQSSEFGEALSPFLRTGSSFAAARQQAVEKALGPQYAAILTRANNILGVEYCKALLSCESSIQPKTIPRIGGHHDSMEEVCPNAILSASQLRQLLAQGHSLEGLIPAPSLKIISREMAEGRCPADVSQVERAILAKLRTMGPEDFAALPDISEGLENRLYTLSRQARSLDELYSGVKSKRYSHARIRRLIACAFMGMTPPLPTAPPYARVLAVSEYGKQMLGEVSRSSQIPLLTRPKDLFTASPEIASVFAVEQQATDLYALSLPTPPACGWECRHKLQIVAPSTKST